MTSLASLLAVFSIVLVRLAAASTSQFVCPGADGQTINDDQGVSYVLSCSSDSSGGSQTGAFSATNGFTDCLASCDSTSGCTGFTYLGGANTGANGIGSGTCYMKTGYLAIVSGKSNTYVTVRNAATGVAPPYYGPQYTCPANNNTLVTDQFGLKYVIICGYNTNGGIYTTTSTPVGFDDCFSQCSNRSANPNAGGAGYCTGFTYFGGTNGVGTGSCQLANAASVYLGPNSGNNLVAVILQANYAGPAPTATAYSVTFPPVANVVTTYVTATATTIVPLLPAVTYTVTYTRPGS